MKNILRVAIGNTLSEEKQIVNGVTLFLVAMAEITHGIEEPIKIIGYADDWIIQTTHKHERVSVGKLQKAIDKIVKCADDTGFQISIEKTKAIMFSRKNTAIAFRPRLDIWIKGTKIEQVRKHKILGLFFDTRMSWNEHILSTKAKAEKNEHHQMLSPHQMGADQGNFLTIHKMKIVSTLRYREEAYPNQPTTEE
jgi:hypothetical protein